MVINVVIFKAGVAESDKMQKVKRQKMDISYW